MSRSDIVQICVFKLLHLHRQIDLVLPLVRLHLTWTLHLLTYEFVFPASHGFLVGHLLHIGIVFLINILVLHHHLLSTVPNAVSQWFH